MGVNQVLHSDISEHLIVIANDELENSYSSGWNIVSSPLSCLALQLMKFLILIIIVLNYLTKMEKVSCCTMIPHSSQIEFQFLVGITWFLKMRLS